MSWPAARFGTASELMVTLDELSEREDQLFRGQPEPWDRIDSSIDRLLGPVHDYPRKLGIEADSITAFRAQSCHFLTSHEQAYCDAGTVDALTVMRHYGAPTRLVDWTLSPYVAAYFAAIHEPDADGVIWCFHADRFRSGADHALDACRVARRHDGARDLDAAAFSHDSRPWIAPISLAIPFIRPELQQGLFTMAGRLGLRHDALIAALIPDQVRRIIVPRTVKSDLIDRLRKRGTHAWSLRFAGADDLGRRIQRTIESAASLPARSEP